MIVYYNTYKRERERERKRERESEREREKEKIYLHVKFDLGGQRSKRQFVRIYKKS